MYPDFPLAGPRWRRTVVFFSLLVLSGFPVPDTEAADPNEFLVYNYDQRNDGTVELPGRLFVPQDYDPSRSYPIVLFFHGSGETGNNNTSQVGNNINNLLANAKSRDFFIYAPQLYEGGNAWNISVVDNAMRMVGNAMDDYNIDPSRLYVTGLSLGGGGTWTATSRYSGVVAAGMPIAGTAGAPATNYILNTTSRLVGMPMWVHHARNDGTVGVGLSRNQINAIRKADGNKPALTFPTSGQYFYEENGLRYTEYASGGHGIWSSIYNTPAVYDWMLAQSKPVQNTALHEGERVLLDFGNRQPTYNTGSQAYVPDSHGYLWNSTAVYQASTLGTALPFVQTDAGRQTSVLVDVDTPFSTHVMNGVVTGSPFDFEIGTDGWITVAMGEGIIRLRGLTSGDSYRLELYASNDNNDGGRGRMSRYQIGDDFADLQVYGNVDTMVIFDLVSADANGEITLHVMPTPGSTSRYGQINDLILTSLGASAVAVPEPGTVGLILLGSAAVSVFRFRRLFGAV